MVEILIATLAITGITNTLTTSSIFGPMQRWLSKKSQDATLPDFVRIIVFMPTCQYCLSHWIGFLAGWWGELGIVGTFAAIWLANHALIVYDMLVTKANTARSVLYSMSRGGVPPQQPTGVS